MDQMSHRSIVRRPNVSEPEKRVERNVKWKWNGTWNWNRIGTAGLSERFNVPTSFMSATLLRINLKIRWKNQLMYIVRLRL